MVSIWELIVLIRQGKDVESNFALLQSLLKEMFVGNALTDLNSRELVSVCDTYADYGNDIQARNALLISELITMLRFTSTIVSGYRKKKIPVRALWDGLQTMDIDNQDTLLNLTRRLHRLLKQTPMLFAIYQILIQRAMSSDNTLSVFANMSAKPERVFPDDPFIIKDNYGI